MKRTTQTLLAVFAAVLVAFVILKNAPGRRARLERLTVQRPDGAVLDDLMPPAPAPKRGGGPSGGPLPSFTGKGYVWAARQIRTATKSWAPITVLRDGQGSSLATAPGEIYLWINDKNRVVAGGSWAQPRTVQHGGRVATMPGRGLGVVMEQGQQARGAGGGGAGEPEMPEIMPDGQPYSDETLSIERLRTLEPTGPSSGSREWDVLKTALGQQNNVKDVPWYGDGGSARAAARAAAGEPEPEEEEYDEDWELDYDEDEDDEYASPPGPGTNKYGAMAVGLDGSMTPFDPYRQVSAAESQKYNQMNAGPLYGVHYTKALDYLRNRGVKGDLLVLRLSGDESLAPIPTPSNTTVLHVNGSGLIQNVQPVGRAMALQHGIVLARYRL